jgi:hypothetical protein
VTETLTPVAYVGPAEGTPRDQWVLKSPSELLNLKICDPAMGSGAFLVQACRWLSDRLVEAWSLAEETGKTVSVDGEVLDTGVAKEPLPRDSEARTVIARRLIAERCLYGVDLNRLAVELAKLSIWLVTLAKGRPFGFLDHNLRCGDSLLGIHRLDQLTELSMTPGRIGQQRLFGKNIEMAVRQAMVLRQRLREMPIRDILDVEAMARLDSAARRSLEVPHQIADAFVGEVFSARGESSLDTLAIEAGQAVDGDQNTLTAINTRARSALSVDLSADQLPRSPFHWPLEFPEVFSLDGYGFDALIGNPPFLGGRRITYRHSETLLNYLKTWLNGAAGTTDLCVYFLLRSSLLAKDSGHIGLILSDIVSQGESRVNGLERLISDGVSIYSCISSMQWPGLAGVKISQVYLAKAGWKGLIKVNGEVANGEITSYLQNSGDQAESSPRQLAANKDICFSGHYLMGQGFVLTAQERSALIELNSNSHEVIFPYIRGDDINNESDQRSGGFAINFSMRELDECEERYPECLKIVRALVKPERDLVKGKADRERWWRYARPRPGLEEKIPQLDEVIVQPFTAKYLFPSFVASKSVFAHPLVVIVRPTFHVYACIQSTIHEKWVWQYCSTSLELLRYTANSVLLTFPFPHESVETSQAGEAYYLFRQALLAKAGTGLTKIYNKFHSPSSAETDIQGLRKLHVELDRAVCANYGWTDINLAHNFRETKQGLRYTISDEAKREVLRRMAELNLLRYEKEVSQGKHGMASNVVVSKALRKRSMSPLQQGLDFDQVLVEHSQVKPLNASSAVLRYLKDSSGWHAKADILTAIGITDSQWNAAIADLIAGGKAERQGERRGARYRATVVEGASQ